MKQFLSITLTPTLPTATTNLHSVSRDLCIPDLSLLLLLFSHQVVSNSLQSHGLQHARLLCPLSPAVCSNSCSLSLVMLANHLILCHLFSCCLQSLSAWGFFQWVSSWHQVAKVLELQLQHQSFQWIFRVGFLWDWLVWSPGSPRDSQKSSAPQF